MVRVSELSLKSEPVFWSEPCEIPYLMYYLLYNAVEIFTYLLSHYQDMQVDADYDSSHKVCSYFTRFRSLFGNIASVIARLLNSIVSRLFVSSFSGVLQQAGHYLPG